MVGSIHSTSLRQAKSLIRIIQRLARAIDRKDARSCFQDAAKQRAIEQLVFYQSGVGTESKSWSEYADGTRLSD